MSDPERNKFTNEQLDFIKHRQEAISSGLMENQNQITNYIFTVNTGGALGVLTYIATKTNTDVDWKIQASLICFICGIVLIVGFSGMMYYFNLNILKKNNELARKFYTSNITWEVFCGEISETPDWHHLAHLAFWGAVLTCAAGIVLGVWVICYQ